MASQSVTVEGGIFPPDLLERIAEGDAAGQRPADFWLADGRRLPDELQSAFSDVRTEWDAFQGRLRRSTQSRTTLTREWMTHFLEVLGFRRLTYQQAALETGGERYSISHLSGDSDVAPPIHIVALDQQLDQRDGRRSPHSSVQEYLNRAGVLWGVVTNGRRLRLLRDSERFTRPSYVEFDIEGIIEGNRYPEFVLLYRLMHASRFPNGDAAAHQCLLEDYYTQGIEHGGRVRERLRDGVETALRELGQAFLVHPESEGLRRAVREGDLDSGEYYRELLRLVYRLLFLMVAEERRLIFPDGVDDERLVIYQRYYSVSALRDRVERYSDRDQNQDLWLGLVQTFRLFRDEATADRLSLSALDGELFGPLACQHLEDAHCSNEALMRALWGLSLFRDESKALRRVNYAAINVEEFGSIYESLLDFQPEVDLAPEPRFDLLGGTERKQTGSYYTPPELVLELINSALVPVINERVEAARTREAKEQALLDLRVIDPASGSGHFMLAAARRIATELVRVRAGEDEPSPQAFREAMRDVIRHCIYAVDKNPLAVDLCKVALWIEGHAPGLPLSFLDHHVKCGDSLVGVFDLKVLDKGIPDAAYTAITGDDKSVATAYRKRNREERQQASEGFQLGLGEAADTRVPESLAEEFDALGDLDERTTDGVHEKERLYQSLRSGEEWWTYKIACDLWTAAFFAPLRKGDAEQVPTTRIVRRALREPNALDGHMVGAASAESTRLRFFHWPLEFPDVLIRHGGFDAVLGNPPWERTAFEDREFFLARARTIAEETNTSRRKRLIAELEALDPDLFRDYEASRRAAEGTTHFARVSERFPYGASGRTNTYGLFTDLALHLMRHAGRTGVVVPTGIATDVPMEGFWRVLVDRGHLVQLIDFENREGLFPAVDSRQKFCLLTLRSEAVDPLSSIRCAFFVHSIQELSSPDRLYELPLGALATINPLTKQPPVCRSERDLQLLLRIHSTIPVLDDESREGGSIRPWVGFISQTHSSHYRSRSELLGDRYEYPTDSEVVFSGGEKYIPAFEAKMIHQFDPSFATYKGADDDGLRNGTPLLMLKSDGAVPPTPEPRHWVHADTVDEFLRSKGVTSPWLIGIRDVARATDERTIIACLLPAVGLIQPLNGMTVEDPQLAIWITAALNSFVLDFVARQKTPGTHLNVTIVSQLPIPTLFGLPFRSVIVRCALELSFCVSPLAALARDLGYSGPAFPWNPERRFAIRCELDAAFFHIYGVSRDDVDYIMDTFPIVRRNDEKEHGEYRTKRVILETYDEMTRAMQTGEPYQTRLDPPPADPSVAHSPKTQPEWPWKD